MASITNAKVSFKSGLSTALPKQASPGTFYYTTDTNGFYLGLDGGDYAQIGKDVVALAETSGDLTELKANAKEGDLVYVKDINVLCIYADGDFTQVNPDTYLKSLTAAIQGTKVTITATMNRDPGDGSGTTRVATFNLPAQVTPTVGLATGGTANAVTVSTEGTGITAGDHITVKGSGSVTVAQDADIITITGVDTKTNSKVTSATLTYADGGNLALQLTQDEGGTTVSANDGGKISAAITKVKTDLTEEIKNQLQDLNAMTYKGTVGTEGTVETLPVASVAIGDVYMSNGTVTELGKQTNVKSGDLFIATGTEDEATGFITGAVDWTYVPAGDDTDTHYKLSGASDKINLTATPGGEAGSITVVDDDIVVATVADNTLTINHKNYESPAASGVVDAKPGFGGTFKVLSGVTNEYGHVTGYETKTITLPAEPAKVTDTNTLYSISSDGGVITLTPDGANAGLDEESSVTVEAGTDIEVSGSADTITVAHKTYNTDSVTKKALTFIDGITLSNGHVTGTTVGTVTLPTYKLSGAAVTLAPNKATATINLGGASTSSAKIGFTSSTLDFTGSTGTDVNVDIVWGTFGEE